MSSRPTTWAINSSCFVCPVTIAPMATAPSTSDRDSNGLTANGISQAPGTRTTATISAPSFSARAFAASSIRSGMGALNSLATRAILRNLHLDGTGVLEPLTLAGSGHLRQLLGLEEHPPCVERMFAHPAVAQRCELT